MVSQEVRPHRAKRVRGYTLNGYRPSADVCESYIYPAKVREHMSELWKEDVSHWWLPNDEGYPPIIRAIRDFIDIREHLPTDEFGADVRDMNGIFRSLRVEEQAIPEDLLGMGTDSDSFDPSKDPNMQWESSPEQEWT